MVQFQQCQPIYLQNFFQFDHNRINCKATAEANHQRNGTKTTVLEFLSVFVSGTVLIIGRTRYESPYTHKIEVWLNFVL